MSGGVSRSAAGWIRGFSHAPGFLSGADSPNIAWETPAFRVYADYMATDQFRSALARLLGSAGAGPPMAVLCAETLWWRCHRRLISDALVVAGASVVHLTGPGRREGHALAQMLRVDDSGMLIYDVGVDRPLDLG